MLPLRLAGLFAIGLLALGGIAYAAGSSVEQSRAKAAPQPSFRITGNLSGRLRPGASVRLDLTLRNPNRYAVSVTRLRATVAVDLAHVKRGCSAAKNFAVTQTSPQGRPIRLRPGVELRLSKVRGRRLPVVTMRNLPRDQGACQGARIKLRYKGTSRRVAR